MSSFIVSARKYRPQTFNTVVGQESITFTLKNAIRNSTLAQSFLFCGPRGVGKTTCARILAKTINCLNLSPELEACDQCESCKSFNQSASFNIHELDAASNNSVDDIRLLVDQVRIPPQVGTYKVYIIDEVHMLSAQAFNAFLKTLEEPPSYAKFILATTEKHKIIPTILSRCQIYDFKRISNQDIVNHLEYVAKNEGVEYEIEGLHVISQKSDGALRDALSMFDQIVSFSNGRVSYDAVIDNLNVLDFEFYFKTTRAILQGNIQEVLLIFNEIIERGFDGLHFNNGLAAHFRNLLICRDQSTAKLFESGEALRSRYVEQANSCRMEFLFKALEITNTCDLNYKSSSHKRLLVELCLMQLVGLLQAKANPDSGNSGKITPVTPPPPAEKSSLAPPPSPEKLSASPAPLPKSGILTAKRISIQQPGPKAGVAQAEGLEAPAISKLRSEEFQQEDLLDSWNNFVASCIEEPSVYSWLSTRTPVIIEKYTLELVLDNSLQQTFLQEKKQQLVEYLRNALKNDSIQLNFRVEEKMVELKAYTQTEKYNRMQQINPDITSFKNELNLDLSI